MRWYSLTLVLLLSSSAAAADSRRDRGGEPLPAGAVGRLGGLQLRHTRPAFALAFAPDGKTLATASLDGNIYFWDPRTGKKLRSLSADCPAGLSGLRWSGDGKSLLVPAPDTPFRNAAGRE